MFSYIISSRLSCAIIVHLLQNPSFTKNLLLLDKRLLLLAILLAFSYNQPLRTSIANLQGMEQKLVIVDQRLKHTGTIPKRYKQE
jgi:hypothetical protein